ncbi:N/A [soil metagenome]
MNEPVNYKTKIREILGRNIRSIFERLTGWHIHTVNPRGVYLADDIKNVLPHYEVRVVFDVGANIGQSTNRYLKAWDNAVVYSFEPVSDTFEQLKRNLISPERVQCFKLAFGPMKEQGEMILAGDSKQFMLREHYMNKDYSQKLRTQQVEVETLDNFCQNFGIEHISLLKVDTEGHDLQVLHGAANLLKEHKVDLIQVEVGMNSLKSLHVSLESVKNYLEQNNYYMFGLYEQVGDWSVGSAVLRRADAVFVSFALSEQQVQ